MTECIKCGEKYGNLTSQPCVLCSMPRRTFAPVDSTEERAAERRAEAAAEGRAGGFSDF